MDFTPTLVFQIPNLLWLVIPVRDIEQIEVIPDGGTITSGILIGTKQKVLNTLIERPYLAILLLVLLLHIMFLSLQNTLMFASIEDRPELISRVKTFQNDLRTLNDSKK